MNAVLSPKAKRRPAEPALTDEQLALALRHLQRPHWPKLLADALAHPMYGPLVRGLARQMGRQRVCLPAWAPTQRPAAPPVPATPTGLAWARPARNTFDARRAAANDFDET